MGVQFGQVVFGPSGAGKSTYVHGMAQAYSQINRPFILVNLDPANENLPYQVDVDIRELITLEEVAEELGLGPNGALIYCIEYLEKNVDWLLNKLSQHQESYVMFDCPGQIELYMHHTSMRNIVEIMMKNNKRLCAVNLIDAVHCADPANYISAVLLSLQMMIHMELPHINILSKADLLGNYDGLAFNLDYYTEVQDLNYLLPHLEETQFGARFASLSRALCELIEGFSLVSFLTLSIQEKESVANVIKAVDKAIGFTQATVDDLNPIT
ncbi:GPN-loop GTPase [Cladochytrium replicatum]|nr:GPN-loop GTPase [Cladochytrium replicatum]